MSAPSKNKQAVLELTVNNHPGVMSHVCGLFSRRAYNVEGIACMPLGDGSTSRIWLQVEESDRLGQMMTQAQNLQDVLALKRHRGQHPVFLGLTDVLKAESI